MKRYLSLLIFILTLSSALALQSTNSTLGAEGLLGVVSLIVVSVWFLIIFIILLVVVSIIAFIWALVDILKARNKEEWKIMWVLVTFFFGIIGVILYLIIGRKQRK